MNYMTPTWEMVNLMHGWTHGPDVLEYRVVEEAPFVKRLEIRGAATAWSNNPVEVTDQEIQRPVARFSDEFWPFFNQYLHDQEVILERDEGRRRIGTFIDRNGYFKFKFLDRRRTENDVDG